MAPGKVGVSRASAFEACGYWLYFLFVLLPPASFARPIAVHSSLLSVLIDRKRPLQAPLVCTRESPALQGGKMAT